MVETELTVLSRTQFLDTTNPQQPKQMTRVVFQLPDGRVGDITIPTDDVKTDKEKKALAEAVKALPANVTERVKVDI